jgi:CRP-like cAMP-binding protein
MQLDDATPRADHRPEHAQPEDPRAGERNLLLRALGRSSYESLAEHLEPIHLPARHVLWKANTPIRSVYFPRTCVTSLLVMLEEESPVESATVGREGLVGIPVALGVESTSTQAIAQVPGDAARLPVVIFREFLARDADLAMLVHRYAQALLEQTSQSVACNRRHAMEERCARWLLMTHDRVGADDFSLTHDFLAFMLGVRRASVTVAAGMLQQAGLIRYARGKVTIVDRARLEEASCECYRSVRQRFDQLLGAATG